MEPSSWLQLRKATSADEASIRELIAVSSRSLARRSYGEALVEAALRTVLGVDSQLIEDGTYFVAETRDRLVGCGGWSRRRTLYGSDTVSARDDRVLDPASEPAKIRAFFVHPHHVRRGIAREILRRCEAEAREEGFRRLELGATLSGVKFYLSAGFRPHESIFHECGPGLSMEIVPMDKLLD